MAQKLRVLIVEDTEQDAALLVRELKRGGFDLTYKRVENAEQMTAAIEAQEWDIVVSDYSLPRFSAPAALKLVKETGLDLPFIVVSGTISEDVAVEVMRAGARDFMAKGQFSRLLPAIAREMREAALRAEHKTTEQRLIQAQKMEAVGQLTGGLAHDFNNILMIVMANVDMLDEEEGLSDGQRHHVEQIGSAARRASELTRQLLAFSRKQPLRPQATDLNALVASTGRLLHRTLGEHIRIDQGLADDLWTVKVDRAQFQSALLNLCVNARDAMPGGGRLLIETANVDLDQDYADRNPDVNAGPYVMLAVTDSGRGMSEKVVARVFEPFFTTKEVGKGSGLGLSMVYGFIRQSKGHIKIYSEQGHGTSVKIYLPRSHSGHEGDRIGAAAMVGGSEHVLLVEDDTLVRAGVAMQLTSLGYKVTEAENGVAGLEILEAGDRSIDVLLTDMVMPGRLSGLMLAGEVGHRWPTVRRILMSGYTENAVVQDGQLEDGVRLLIKPFRKIELAQMLREVLEAPVG
jgi:signal transduction histidine kinase